MTRLTVLALVLAAATPAASQDKADPKRAADLKDRIAAKKAELAALEAELAKVSPPAEQPKDRALAAAQKAGEELYAKELAHIRAAKKQIDEAAAKFADLVQALPKGYNARLLVEMKKFQERAELFTRDEAKSREAVDAETELRKVAERELAKTRAQLKGVQAELAKLKAGEKK